MVFQLFVWFLWVMQLRIHNVSLLCTLENCLPSSTLRTFCRRRQDVANWLVKVGTDKEIEYFRNRFPQVRPGDMTLSLMYSHVEVFPDLIPMWLWHAVTSPSFFHLFHSNSVKVCQSLVSLGPLGFQEMELIHFLPQLGKQMLDCNWHQLDSVNNSGPGVDEHISELSSAQGLRLRCAPSFGMEKVWCKNSLKLSNWALQTRDILSHSVYPSYLFWILFNHRFSLEDGGVLSWFG